MLILCADIEKKKTRTSQGLIYVKALITCLAKQAYEYRNAHESLSGLNSL